MDDEIADYYRLDAVITVVDAKHGMETLDKQEEAQKQVGFADRLLISKKDLVNDVDYQALRARLVHINPRASIRSEEHTSELQSLMRISYAVFCLKKKKNNRKTITCQQIHIEHKHIKC